MKRLADIRKIVFTSIVFIMLAILPAVGLSDVPRQINYQGYLAGSDGNPVPDGNYQMSFAFYNTSTGGSSWWSESQTVVMTSGYYHVILGKPGNYLDPDDFDGGCYLGVRVGSDAEMRPRLPITATAFSFRSATADDADRLGGQHAGAFMSAGTDNWVDAAGDTMTGTLTLPSNGLRVGSNQLVMTGGRIGLGTSSPNEQLEITGSLRLPATTSTNGIIRSGSGRLIHRYGGTRNFFAGLNAGNLTMTGNNNTGTGYQALNSNTSGYRNTAVGRSALYAQSFSNEDTDYDSFNTAVGFNALLDNNPTESGNGVKNTAIGGYALENNTTGIHGTALGYNAGASSITGNGNTLIGCNTDVSAGGVLNGTALGFGAVVNGSNRVRIGNAYVGQIGGNVGWSNLSDLRRKKDIEDITLGLYFINSLRPVEFSLINGDGGVDLGFIAQDVESLLGKEYNILGIDEDEDRTLSLRYTDFIAPMVKAIQEQHKIILELRAEIEALKADIEVVKADRESLQAFQKRALKME